MKRQSSVRSLGHLFTGNVFARKGDRRPLIQPSVDGDGDDFDDSIVKDTSDPLIGKTIDADQTVEDEVRMLLGLTNTAAAGPPAAATAVTSSRRSSLPRSNSGDGVGGRYVRKKGAGSMNNHRQRSMRGVNSADQSDQGTEVPKPESPTEVVAQPQQRRRSTLGGRQRSSRRVRSNSSTDQDDSKMELPANGDDSAMGDVPQDRRRTLTKIRKSSRRITVSTNSFSEDDVSIDDWNASSELHLQQSKRAEEEERKPVAREESSLSKNESKDGRRESRTTCSGNGPNDSKDRRKPSSTTREGSISLRRPSNTVGEDGERKMDDRNSSRRQLSSRVAEDGEKKAPSTRPHGNREGSSYRRSSSGMGEDGDWGKSNTNSKEVGAPSSRRPSLKGRQSSSRKVADDGGCRSSLRDKEPSSRRTSGTGPDPDRRPSRSMSMRDKRTSSRKVSDSEYGRESRRSLVSEVTPSSRRTAEQRPEHQTGIKESSRNLKVSKINESERDKGDEQGLFDGLHDASSRPPASMQFPSTLNLGATTNISFGRQSSDNVQPFQTSSNEKQSPPERRPALQSSRSRSLDGRQACDDDDYIKASPAPQESAVQRRSSSKPARENMSDGISPRIADKDSGGSITNDDNDDNSDQNFFSKEEYAQIMKTDATMSAASTSLSTTSQGDLNPHLGSSDQPRNSNYLKVKKRHSGIASFCAVKVISDVHIKPDKEKAEISLDNAELAAKGPPIAYSGNAPSSEEDVLEIDPSGDIAPERTHQQCEEFTTFGLAKEEILESEECPRDAESSKLQQGVSMSNHSFESPPELQPVGTESQKEIDPEAFVNDHEVGIDRANNMLKNVNSKEAASDASHLVDTEKQNDNEHQGSSPPPDDDSCVEGKAQESVASRIKAFEAFSNVAMPPPQPCSEGDHKRGSTKDQANVQDCIGVSMLEANDLEIEQLLQLANNESGKDISHKRRVSDVLFRKPEEQLRDAEVEIDNHNTLSAKVNAGEKRQPETRYDRRRSEGANSVNSVLRDHLLSPLSATSPSKTPWTEFRPNELNVDRWAAISPMGVVCVTRVEARNELLIAPQSPRRSDSELKSDKWACMSPMRPIDVPHLPPRTDSDRNRVAPVAEPGTGRVKLNHWYALGPTRSTSSLTEVQLRRRSVGDIREYNIHSPFKTQTNSPSENFETLKQQLREARCTPTSPMLPLFLAKESPKRRNTFCVLTHTDGLLDQGNNEDAAPVIHAGLLGSQVDQVNQELREDRWAPISPMRPIVPVLLQDTEHFNAPPFTDDAGVKSERWLASAGNQLPRFDLKGGLVMKASGREQIRSQSVSCNEDLSMDSFGLIMEDEDDNDARVAAQQAAWAHSRHEKSISQMQPENEASGNSKSFADLENDDEYARMMARKTALEHLIGQHMAALSQLNKELEQVEDRLQCLGAEASEASTNKVRPVAKSA